MVSEAIFAWAGVGLLSIILAATLIYVSVILGKLRALTNIKENFTFLLNLSDEYSKYRLFLELPETVLIEDRLKIRAIPLDHFFDERLPIPPSVETIAIRKDLRKESAPGGFSNYRHFAILVPETKAGLNKFIKQHLPELADLIGKDIDRKALARLVEKRIDGDYDFFLSVIEERIPGLELMMLFSARKKEFHEWLESVVRGQEKEEKRKVI